MKTEEDEAFEAIERRQGGFQAKRAMAADKLQDGKCKYCVDGCIACDARAQPTQEPIAYVTGMSFGRFIVEPLNPAMVLPVGMALYSSPQEKT